ncbi:MAG: exo-alpha-sialidase [Planctomycetaceae bacterium]
MTPLFFYLAFLTNAEAQREFCFTQAPFAECHASSIVETCEGLLVAYFAGSTEGAPDVGVWLSRKVDEQWSRPTRLLTATDAAGRPVPCWNPVLWHLEDGSVLLFYKAGPSPREWWGMLTISTDCGRTWSTSRRLPTGFLGPIKNKPLLLPGKRLICGSSTEDAEWRIHLEISNPLGTEWSKTAPLSHQGVGLIQPTLLRHSDTRLQMLCRSQQQAIYELWSEDAGRTWTEPRPTSLPNPNSGIDGVSLAGGGHLLVYNHSPRERSPLVVSHSTDGRNWRTLHTLESEPGEYSYPAIIQTEDGNVHVVYTWQRKRIAHVELTPPSDPTKN